MGWYIAAGILALLLTLLLSPVSLRASYRDGTLTARARYLFFSCDLSPDKLIKRLEQPKEAKKREKKKRKTKEKPEKARKKIGISSLLPLLFEASRGAMHTLHRHIVVDKVQVRMAVTGEDAHRAALNFSAVSSAVYGVLALVGLLVTLRPPKIHLQPDFTGTETRCSLSLRIRVRPWFLLWAGLRFLVRFLTLTLQSRPRKGGINYEPTASHQ